MFGLKDRKKIIHDIRGELVGQSIKLHADFANDLLKWYIASLLLLNGGALVSLMRIGGSNPEAMPSLAWPFVVGLVVNVLAGFSFAIGSSIAANKLAGRVWKGEEFGESEIDLVLENEESLIWAYVIGLLLSFASLGLFVFGAYNFADAASELRPAIDLRQEQ